MSYTKSIKKNVSYPKLSTILIPPTLQTMNVQTYTTEIYHQLNLPIETIIACMKDEKLSKTAITKWDQILTVYDTGGGYNLFLLDGYKVWDRQECTLEEAIEAI